MSNAIYSKITVFESELAYQAKLKAAEIADKKAAEERTAIAVAIFNCVVRGGEWNSAGNYCINP